MRALSVGAVRPKPGHKGLFVKSPLESQKLRQNKVICLMGNSFAYFSYKKSRCVLLFTFLSGRESIIEHDRNKNNNVYCFFKKLLLE